MSKVLVLARSGFGKSTSIGKDDELGIIGLDPRTTFIISVKNKPLPFFNSTNLFKITGINNPKEGNRVITNSGEEIASLVLELSSENCPFTDIIIDDMNYIMQDYYMENALKSGWDCPKKIGYFMGKLFRAIDFCGESKNIYVLAHSEETVGNDGRTYVKFKTTGRMVDEYCTPEGLFDIVLVGRSKFNATTKQVVREFLTNEDEFISSAKSPRGMFDLYIPNDLGLVKLNITKYYNGEINH